MEAFFFPAYLAVIPQITPPESLQSANSLNSLSQRVMGIIGPAMGAALVALGGTSVTFGLDALSFFISAFFVFPILRMNVEKIQKAEISTEMVAGQKSINEAVKGGFADLRVGLKTVVSIPWIWISILLFGLINITEASPRAVAMPFLIKENLGADVELLGLLGSASSLGFVIGTIWLGGYRRLHRRGILGYLTTMVTGAVLLLFGFKLAIPILVFGMFIGGLCTSVFALIWNHTLQEMVPVDLLGRVYSIDALGSFVLLPIGFSIAGWATDWVGAPIVFLVGGFATIALTALALFHPAVRNLD